VEVLFVTEIIGITLIWIGYRVMTPPPSIPVSTPEAATD